jgi:hypothetical protein
MSNPYELRFKVLEMARDLEMNRYDQTNGAFWHLYTELENTVAKIRDTGDIVAVQKLEDQLNYVKSFLPKIPNPSEIKLKAQELYEFVTEK